MRKHKGLYNISPIDQLHEELTRDEDPVIRTLPHNYLAMNRYCLPVNGGHRKIQEHRGIQVDNRFYNDAILIKIIRHLEKKRKPRRVDVYVDQNDYGYICIRDPRSNELVPIKYKFMESGHKLDECIDIGISTEKARVQEGLAKMSSDDIVEQAEDRKKRMDRDAKSSRTKPKTAATKMEDLTDDELEKAFSLPPRASMATTEEAEPEVVNPQKVEITNDAIDADIEIDCDNEVEYL